MDILIRQRHRLITAPLSFCYKTTLSIIALKYRYYDQSHFIHHFKRFYGLAPGQ
ncbi:AraC family transcriptional regulator [Paenibacillus sp. JMULE4]|nr:AraC family transcriptional regulator [Paenibacillus sp. JMULE4]